MGKKISVKFRMDILLTSIKERQSTDMAMIMILENANSFLIQKGGFGFQILIMMVLMIL